MKINGHVFNSLQASAKAQIGQARKRFVSIRSRASRALLELASESRARGAQWTQRVRSFTSRRGLHLDQWQSRLMDVVGVASRSQLRRISRELARLNKKVDALSSDKRG